MQYGIWQFDGNGFGIDEFQQAEQLLSAYAPDGIARHIEPSIGLLCGAFHTVPMARRETQPYVLASGTVLVWDGRLDNREELIAAVGDRIDSDSSDVEIVAECYRKWAFARLGALLGDWALTVWNPDTRTLILAKDFLGTRQLYYRITEEHIAWSNVLDPLVHSQKQSLSFCGEYLAGCLSSLPAPHLTAYNEICSVPPSSYLLVNGGRVTRRKYWDFDPGKLIRYRTDSEYEAQFLDLFRQSVRRRLRSAGTVLAELSGGMDSSSIVCLADDLIATNDANCCDLRTISYFSASEPDWDEAPYFAKVEERRGRVGVHVDLGACGFFRFTYDPDSRSLSPNVTPETHPDQEIDRIFRKSGIRVLLSGIGGDEFLGGVPTASPELADLLAAFRLRRLAHQLKEWALAQRKPWFYLLANASRDFLPLRLRTANALESPAPWIQPAFAKHHRDALAGYPDRIRFTGPRPSFQHAIGTVDVLRRSMAWFCLSPSRPCEKRYPYLDRCLLEFLFAIPREQLVRPGQRRSLMRRAMRGIVPDEIITRKRKAFVARAPLAALAKEWQRLVAGHTEFALAALGIVDQSSLLAAMQDARNGREVTLVSLVRTVALECWLRQLSDCRSGSNLGFAATEPSALRALAFPQEKGGENHEIRETRSCRVG